MELEQFRNYARLYVIGALNPREINDFEEALKKFGLKGSGIVRECYALKEFFNLSVRPKIQSVLLRERLMSMERERAKR